MTGGGRGGVVVKNNFLRKKFFGTKGPNNLQVFNPLNLAALYFTPSKDDDFTYTLNGLTIKTTNVLGASVAKWLAHLPFTSEAAGSSPSENFLNATRTQSSCEKSKSQRSAESHGFPPGTPVSSHRES